MLKIGKSIDINVLSSNAYRTGNIKLPAEKENEKPSERERTGKKKSNIFKAELSAEHERFKFSQNTSISQIVKWKFSNKSSGTMASGNIFKAANPETLLHVICIWRKVTARGNIHTHTHRKHLLYALSNTRVTSVHKIRR